MTDNEAVRLLAEALIATYERRVTQHGTDENDAIEYAEAILATLDGEVVPKGTLAQNERLIVRTADLTMQVDGLLKQVAALREALDWFLDGPLDPLEAAQNNALRALDDTAQAAQDHDRQVVEPWRNGVREALAYLEGDIRVGAAVGTLRALLASGEPVEGGRK